MFASNLPAPWIIDEIERMRRIREAEADEQARIPLYPPEPLSPFRRPVSEEPITRSCVIVIDMC